MFERFRREVSLTLVGEKNVFIDRERCVEFRQVGQERKERRNSEENTIEARQNVL